MSATANASVVADRIEPLSVVVNTSASLVGNVVATLCQAGLVIALARLGSPALIGQFALGLAISGPVMLLASLQLRSVQVTDAAQRHQFAEYLGLRLITAVLAMAVIILLALLVHGPGAFAAIVLIGVLRNVQAISDIYRGVMQQSERMERVAISMIARGVAEVPIFALALLVSGTLAPAVAALIVTDLLVWRLYDVPNARRLLPRGARIGGWSALFGAAPRYDLRALLPLARTALPLGVVAMLLSLNTYVPQYAVKRFSGEAELGIFAALLYAAVATSVIFAAAGQAASPRLAKLYEAGEDARFRLLHTHLLYFGAAVGGLTIAAALLAGAPLLHLVYGAEYARHSRLFVELCAVAAVINTISLQGYSVTATRSFRPQLPISLIAALTAVVASFLFVPRFGLHGAAAAILAGALVQGCGYTMLLRYARQRIRPGVTAEASRVVP